MISKKIRDAAIKIGKSAGEEAFGPAEQIVLDGCEEIVTIKGYNRLSGKNQEKLFDIAYDAAWKALNHLIQHR